MGCPKIVLKTDQEPAMIALQKEIRKELWQEITDIMNKLAESRKNTDELNKKPGGVIILESSPVGESQSNGIVERAIKEVQHQIRKLNMQLEANTSQRLENDSPIWPWLI